jgi:hypothetical protein
MQVGDERDTPFGRLDGSMVKPLKSLLLNYSRLQGSSICQFILNYTTLSGLGTCKKSTMPYR